MTTLDGGLGGLDPSILAAIDATLVPAAGDAQLLVRLRKLIENCLDDNYDATDVRSIIELAIAADAETGHGA